MYADRYAQPGGVKPGSLAVAVGINAAVVAALIFASPEIRSKLPDPPLRLQKVFETPPPKPDKPLPEPQPRHAAKPVDRIEVEVSKPAIESTALTNPTYVDPGLKPEGGVPGGVGTLPLVQPTPIAPVFHGSEIDPRYMRDFQPDYPAGERRAEREGVVKVRVLVGVDGRVRQVERVQATSDAFFRTTEQQALAKWRFKPATRDGIPVESWRTMSVTFVLKE